MIETYRYKMPLYTNPAEFVIQLINTDFSSPPTSSSHHLSHLHTTWSSSPNATALSQALATTTQISPSTLEPVHASASAPRFNKPLTLIHRSFIKSYRDVVAYGIRIAMYLGLSLMMGTVWLRLAPTQANIQAFTNAIFFGGAFMSFMAVAYIPSYLEDLSLYRKERANGLYGPTAFMVSNFVVGVPYLFLITMLFSVVSYWLGNFNPTAQGFWTWVMWLFLDLLAAESLVVLLSSLIPIFVVSLAATAFANGLWMCVNGFMVCFTYFPFYVLEHFYNLSVPARWRDMLTKDLQVQPDTLNPFWRYVFHYIDYQAYVFRGMMVNEFGGRNYTCGDGCKCIYASAFEDQCMIDGKAVLSVYGYDTGNTGKYVGYMLLIILAYRVLGWLVLWVRKH